MSTASGSLKGPPPAYPTKTQPVTIPKGLTSFPEGFTESPRDQTGLTGFYTKVKSAASIVMSNVLLPHKQEEVALNDTVQMSSPLSQSPLLYLPDRNRIRSGQHRKSSPSRAHINLEEVSAHGTRSDKFQNRPGAVELSRTASTNTVFSYNPRSHLPGFATERDNSDTESIMSTASRDYILPSAEKWLDPLKSGGLSREFWMRDENAAECFNCARPFNSKYTRNTIYLHLNITN
jgi:hypothetical protein